jgi:hypothetical protein
MTPHQAGERQKKLTFSKHALQAMTSLALTFTLAPGNLVIFRHDSELQYSWTPDSYILLSLTMEHFQEYPVGDFVMLNKPSDLAYQQMEIKQTAVIGKFEPQYLCSYAERNGKKRMEWFTHSEVELIKSDVFF